MIFQFYGCIATIADQKLAVVGGLRVTAANKGIERLQTMDKAVIQENAPLARRRARAEHPR